MHQHPASGSSNRTVTNCCICVLNGRLQQPACLASRCQTAASSRPCSRTRPRPQRNPCRLYSLRYSLAAPTIARLARIHSASCPRPDASTIEITPGHHQPRPDKRHWAIPFVSHFPLRQPSVSNTSMDSPYNRPADNGTVAWSTHACSTRTAPLAKDALAVPERARRSGSMLQTAPRACKPASRPSEADAGQTSERSSYAC